MSIATSPYRPLMQPDVPIQKWLNQLFDLLKKRQHFVDVDSFANHSGYECDEQDVMLVTSRHLDGLPDQAEADIDIDIDKVIDLDIDIDIDIFAVMDLYIEIDIYRNTDID